MGRRLIPALLAKRHAVRALSRRPDGAGLPAEVELAEWNGRTLPKEAAFRTRAVVHLSGEPVFGGRLTDARRRRIHDSRIVSTDSIVSAIEELPEGDRPQTLVCASAVGFYGDRGDEILDEEGVAGEGFLADVCVAWEKAAAAAESLGVRVVSLRIGIVLAREGGALAGMRLPFSLGLGGQFGDGRQWFPWIHIDDLVALTVAALEDERYRGPVNAVAPNPVTNAQLTESLGRQLRRPTWFRVPAFAARAALGELSGELLGSRRAVPRAALDRGFGFRYADLDEALAAEL